MTSSDGERRADAAGAPAGRLLIYGINYAPEVAGVGPYTGQIGSHLVTQGWEVTVVTTPPHYPGWRVLGGYSGAGWTREAVDGAVVYRCPLFLDADMKGIKRLLAPLSFALTSAPVVLWQALRSRPDVVLIIEPTLFAAPIGLAAARLVGARTVLHVQDLEVEAAFAMGHLGEGGLLSRLAGAFDRVATCAFDRVVTISNKMAEKIAAKGVAASRIRVVRNWVDLDRIRPITGTSAYRTELGIPKDGFVALYSGNIGAKQGVRLLIEAAERLCGDPHIVFVVAGEGPMKPALVQAAARLPNLRLLPFQPEDRFSDFLGLADLHLLPQEREAADLLLPSKLGGMLASGKPVAVTAEPGTELADFLGDSCILTPPGDGAALADAVARAASAPACGLQAQARLELARSLSKRSLINAFTNTLVFRGCEPGRAARTSLDGTRDDARD